MTTQSSMADGIAENLSFRRPYGMVTVDESHNPEQILECRIYVDDMHPFSKKDLEAMREMGWGLHTFRLEETPMSSVGRRGEPHVLFHHNLDSK